MNRKAKFLFVLAWIALILPACGAGGPTTTINLLMTDFHFEPMEYTVPAGQEITINVTNNGAVVHDFVIFDFGTDAGGKYGPEDQDNIYWEVEVLPGGSTTETFTAPTEPGEYYVTCGIVGHLEAGMIGKLTVVAGE